MKKILALLVGVSLMSLLIFISCDKRNPTGSEGSGGTSSVDQLQLTVPSGYTAPAGNQVIQVSAKALDDQGQPVSNVVLEFTRTPGDGYISATDSATNANGIQNALYIIDLQNTITVSITAKVKDFPEIAASKSITLSLLTQTIGSVEITSSFTALVIGTQNSISTPLEATVKNPNGVGIPNLKVSFLTNIGVITNLFVTDATGKVGASILFTQSDFPANQNAISTWIKAYLGGGAPSDSTLITVVKTASSPDSIVVIASPNYVVVPINEQGNSTIKAIVMDSNGNGVPGVQVNFSATGGYIKSSAISDTSGEAVATLNSLILSSDITAQVIASVDLGTLADTATVQFVALSQSIGNIYVYAESGSISAQPGGVASTVIKAQVTDTDNIAIPNLQIKFTTNHGAITSPAQTDSFGIGQSTYYSNGYTGQATITAKVGLDSGYTFLNINATGLGSIYITKSQDIIYADGSVTYATVTAVLKNFNNEAIVGDTVHFSSSSPHSKITSPVMTDSTGTASAIFDDIGAGEIEELETSTVIARYDPLGLADTTYIDVAPTPDVDHINLFSSKASGGMSANGVDSAVVNAYVYLTNEEAAPNGTRITFTAKKGIIDIPQAYVQEGKATAVYISGTDTGIDTIRAAWTDGLSIYDELYVQLRAGNPVSIEHESTVPETLYVGGTPALITAVVQDTVGNGVPSRQVTWTTNLGTITVLSLTDSAGYAHALIDPSTSAGVAMITAKVQGMLDSMTVGVPIISGYPSSIQITSDFDQLQVQGTGGQESCSIIATVKDPNGNNVPDGIVVHFTILAPILAGVQFDNNTLMDSSVTNAGQALVSLNSGSESGPVRVRALTWSDIDTVWIDTLTFHVREDTIKAEKSNITIVSGDPQSIDLSLSGDPEQIGSSGSYKSEVSARVQDSYGNNISAGTSVFFWIDSTYVNPWQGPQHAHIDGSATIVDSTGIATTLIYYNTENMLSYATVIARCVRNDGTYAEDSETFQMPAFEPELSLSVIPGGFTFNPPTFAVAVLKCTATLLDGAGIPINNAKICFSSSLGMFFCADSASASIPTMGFGWYPGIYWRFIQYTGPNPPPDLTQSPTFYQEIGQAILWMRAEEENSTYYPGVFNVPLVTNIACEISAYMVADPSINSDPVSIDFRRVLE